MVVARRWIGREKEESKSFPLFFLLGFHRHSYYDHLNSWRDLTIVLSWYTFFLSSASLGSLWGYKKSWVRLAHCCLVESVPLNSAANKKLTGVEKEGGSLVKTRERSNSSERGKLTVTPPEFKSTFPNKNIIRDKEKRDVAMFGYPVKGWSTLSFETFFVHFPPRIRNTFTMAKNHLTQPIKIKCCHVNALGLPSYKLHMKTFSATINSL